MTKPTYFVHGYSDDGKGFDARNWYWRGTQQIFGPAFSGPLGRSWTYCYYSADTNCDLLVSGDREKSIKTLGAELAWEIFDHFSRFRASVDIVAHSMGGLIARAALTGVNKGDPAFPPYLYVEDVVTLSTPHRGAPAGAFCKVAPCPRQVKEMRKNSSFLRWLEDTPEGATGTDWTLIGFDDDLTAPVWSAVPKDMRNTQHKVILFTTTDGYDYIRCDYYSTGCNMADRDTYFQSFDVEGPLKHAAYASNWAFTH
jgi:pimeloyl-ACP methyl ester carboxylesterase